MWYLVLKGYPSRVRGDNGLVITLVPKVCIIIKVFFFVDLTILGTVVNFDWLVHLVDCSNVLTNNCNLLMG